MSDRPRAFPSAAIDDRFGGMTLRDWFAGQALSGLCGAFGKVVCQDGERQPAADARWSYERADAMLAERAK